MKYALYKELLDILEEFEEKNPQKEKQNITDFSVWLYQKSAKKMLKTSLLENKSLQDKSLENKLLENKLLENNNDLDISIGRFVTFMVRYARNYTKKALENNLLTTSDDFVFLANIFYTNGISPTELITSHILEKTSGIEVVKRLSKNGLITQEKHATDKRSKVLVITELGKEVFFSSLSEMQKVAKIVGGKLSQEEKQQLIYLLEKLNNFHNPIYLEDKNMPLDKILELLEKS